MDSKSISASFGAKEIVFETGKLAQQANAAVLAKLGDTVVLATAVMGGVRDNIDFFPLLVDYEERLYAAGKIKGSRWVKREGRATDEAILSGRVIDRTLRPLFPSGLRNDVQIVATILSVDPEIDPDMVAVNAACMALSISDIPFDGPVAAVRIGKVNGQYVVNPTKTEVETSTMDLIVSGTGEHIMMVEAGLKFVSEAEIIEGVRFAQGALAKLAEAQKQFAQQLGTVKSEVKLAILDERVTAAVEKFLPYEEIEKSLYVATRDEREKNENKIYETVTAQVVVELGELSDINVQKQTKEAINYRLKKYQQKQILDHDRRVDGRRLDETRKITCEVGVLPRTHGSALFTRGETQALTTVTLGSKGDEQLLDGVEDPTEGRAKRYMHHYNFPGYSVGEVTPMRGPGRREIGHGALAERAVEVSLPDHESFPYTMRLVSEILSSNGSTSMASTCGSTLALMDAGVPIKQIVGGVAMGLVLDEANPSNYKVLTDIAGIEDFNGHMDFKVTGTEDGVTALQLDIKVKGLTPEILEVALNQAKPGRTHILSKMKEALSSPRPELSKYAPRIVTLQIPVDKIRDVIGSGGKVINAIIAETGVKIDIEDDGQVFVAGVDAAMVEKAIEWIKNLTREVKPGEEFEGKVTRLMNFGAFVEVLPGQEGMVHVSELANFRVEKVEDVVKVGQVLKVRVKEIDDQGRINLTHKPFAAPAPAGSRTGPSRFGDRSERPRGRFGSPHRAPHGPIHGPEHRAEEMPPVPRPPKPPEGHPTDFEM